MVHITEDAGLQIQHGKGQFYFVPDSDCYAQAFKVVNWGIQPFGLVVRI